MVRIGIVGLGKMGSIHADRIQSGKVPGAVLAAVCDRDVARLESYTGIARFKEFSEMLSSGEIDAVLIATHHFLHTPLSIDAIGKDVHLLVEKPLGVHKLDCQKTIDAYETRSREKLVFSLMLNQRTRAVYRKLMSMISRGELGDIHRFSWTITDWFRPEAYYRSGGWRATWKGEGGGVLLNQCPHQLDLLQWLFGMPAAVRAFGALGKYHEIEVEDEITAYLEYPDGLTGIFIASTGEAPGLNRLEIAAEKGLVVVEGGTILWTRNETATREYSVSTEDPFGKPATEVVTMELPEHGPSDHTRILRNFVDAIEGRADLVAPGTDGIHSVELGNAMLFSALKDVTVRLPLDGAAYESMLQELIVSS